jgi:hypothetical protein
MAQNTKNRQTNRQPKPEQELPPSGPHAKPELTDKEKTGGTGMLPEPDEGNVEGPSG